MASDEQSVTTSLNAATVEWIREHYPDARNDAEAVRTAIHDARHLHRMLVNGA